MPVTRNTSNTPQNPFEREFINWTQEEADIHAEPMTAQGSEGGTGQPRVIRYSTDTYVSEMRLNHNPPTERPPETPKVQAGQIIKSSRRFGIELEASFPVGITLNGNIPHGWNTVSDGSIRGNTDHAGAFEIVSPPLRGAEGEGEVKTVCKTANALGLGVNSSCGFHLHLEALDFKENPRENKKILDIEKPQAELMYFIKETDIPRIYRCPHPTRVHQIPQSDLGAFMINGQLPPYTVKAVPRPSYKLINQGKGYRTLKNLMMFYAVFDDVFRAMQPKSRRMNKYCKPVQSLYSQDEIRRCQTYGDLEALWYRERNDWNVENRKSGGKYDSSRYSGLNLHIFFSKRKTIEIRYHSPTLNQEKILRWIHIHQTAFDKCSREIMDCSQALAEETNIKNKALAMCEVLELDSETTDYIIGRIKKFMDKAEDLEITK